MLQLDYLRKGKGRLSQYNFLIRKVHSLLGIIPVGIFVIFHLLLNSSSLIGVSNYQTVIGVMKGAGVYVNFLEIFVIAIPLLIHALYGLYIVFLSKNNAFQYSYYRNWAFYLQRITALITFVFLLWHVYALRLAVHEPSEVISTLVETLQNPMLFILYIVGVVSAIFHLANGIATFLMSWGITIGPRSQDVITVVSLALFVALSVFSIAILFGLQSADVNSLALLTKGGM